MMRLPPFLFLLLASLALANCSAAAEQPRPVDNSLNGVLLIGNKGEDSLSFVDLKTGEEISRQDTGPNPHEIAISPDARLAAVVNYGGSAIDIFDIAKRERIEIIDISPNSRPHGLLWLDDGRMLATTEGSDTLTIVERSDDGSWTVSGIPTGQQGSHMVAYDAGKNRAYTSNMQSGTVSAIDLDAGAKIADIKAGDIPEGLALTPDGATLWVADRDNATLRVFDSDSFEELALLETGSFPIRVAISPDGSKAVTSNYADGSLSVFDVATRKLDRTIAVSGGRDAAQVTILFSDDGERLYVAETGLNRIAEIDFTKGELRGHLPAGEDGDGLAIAIPKLSIMD